MQQARVVDAQLKKVKRSESQHSSHYSSEGSDSKEGRHLFSSHHQHNNSSSSNNNNVKKVSFNHNVRVKPIVENSNGQSSSYLTRHNNNTNTTTPPVTLYTTNSSPKLWFTTRKVTTPGPEYYLPNGEDSSFKIKNYSNNTNNNQISNNSNNKMGTGTGTEPTSVKGGLYNTPQRPPRNKPNLVRRLVEQFNEEARRRDEEEPTSIQRPVAAPVLIEATPENAPNNLRPFSYTASLPRRPLDEKTRPYGNGHVNHQNNNNNNNNNKVKDDGVVYARVIVNGKTSKAKREMGSNNKLAKTTVHTRVIPTTTTASTYQQQQQQHHHTAGSTYSTESEYDTPPRRNPKPVANNNNTSKFSSSSNFKSSNGNLNKKNMANGDSTYLSYEKVDDHGGFSSISNNKKKNFKSSDTRLYRGSTDLSSDERYNSKTRVNSSKYENDRNKKKIFHGSLDSFGGKVLPFSHTNGQGGYHQDDDDIFHNDENYDFTNKNANGNDEDNGYKTREEEKWCTKEDGPEGSRKESSHHYVKEVRVHRSPPPEIIPPYNSSLNERLSSSSSPINQQPISRYYFGENVQQDSDYERSSSKNVSSRNWDDDRKVTSVNTTDRVLRKEDLYLQPAQDRNRINNSHNNDMEVHNRVVETGERHRRTVERRDHIERRSKSHDDALKTSEEKRKYNNHLTNRYNKDNNSYENNQNWEYNTTAGNRDLHHQRKSKLTSASSDSSSNAGLLCSKLVRRANAQVGGRTSPEGREHKSSTREYNNSSSSWRREQHESADESQRFVHTNNRINNEESNRWMSGTDEYDTDNVNGDAEIVAAHVNTPQSLLRQVHRKEINYENSQTGSREGRYWFKRTDMDESDSHHNRRTDSDTIERKSRHHRSAGGKSASQQAQSNVKIQLNGRDVDEAEEEQRRQHHESTAATMERKSKGNSRSTALNRSHSFGNNVNSRVDSYHQAGQHLELESQRSGSSTSRRVNFQSGGNHGGRLRRVNGSSPVRAPSTSGSIQSDGGSEVSQGSTQSVILHAAAVADIPPPPQHRFGPRRSGRTVHRSFSLLSPWKPRRYKEKYEKKSSPESANGSTLGRPSSALKKSSPSPVPSSSTPVKRSNHHDGTSNTSSSERLDSLSPLPSEAAHPQDQQKHHQNGETEKGRGIRRRHSMPKDSRFSGLFRKKKAPKT